MVLQRRRRAKWLKYEQASMIARDAGCVSRKSYWDWWNASRPNNIPKMPNRVYKEWTTWGEFLGTTNVFLCHEVGNYRPYWEAVRWSQVLCRKEGLTRSIDWLHYYDAHEVEIPDDIPRNAQYHYRDEWQGWATWLGSNVQVKVEAARVELSVFGLCRESYGAGNVLHVVVAKSGVSQLKEIVEGRGLNIFKVYAFEQDQAGVLQRIMHQCGNGQPDGSFIVSNMDALMFELGSVVDEVELG